MLSGEQIKSVYFHFQFFGQTNPQCSAHAGQPTILLAKKPKYKR